MNGNIKIPRFITEYARNKMIKINDIALSGNKPNYPHAEKITAIEKAIAAYKRGLITLDEAMRLIAEA